MRDFEQLDVIPIYQGMGFIFPTLMGLQLLDEKKKYTLGQVWLVIFMALISLSGILVLAAKNGSISDRTKGKLQK
jgi:hypothetical protein